MYAKERMKKMSTLIGADQSILLWAVVLVTVAAAIHLEQRYRWAASIGSITLILLAGLAFSNIGLIPYSTPTFSAIGSVILPCAIPLFLFKLDIKKILRDSGKMLIVFHISAVGTVIGCFLGYLVFQSYENTSAICNIAAAAGVGGTVNAIAMGNVFQHPEGLLEAYLVVGNLTCGFMILLFKILHNSSFIKKFLPRPHTDAYENSGNAEELAAQNKTAAAAFWGGKEVGLKDIATALAAAFLIVGISNIIANWVVSLNPPTFIAQTFGSIYLVMTLVTAFCATVFSKFFGNIKGSMELGNIGLLAWFFTIGCSGNIVEILKGSAVTFCIICIVITVNLIVSVIGAKFVKGTWEDAVCACTATIGGPPTAAAVAVAFNWSELVVPGMLVGLWGYLIGNYTGVLVGNILGVPTLF